MFGNCYRNRYVSEIKKEIIETDMCQKLKKKIKRILFDIYIRTISIPLILGNCFRNERVN